MLADLIFEHCWICRLVHHKPRN